MKRSIRDLACLTGAIGLISTSVQAQLAPNTEPEQPSAGNAGFSISRDGSVLVGNPDVSDKFRRVDLDLARSNLDVRFDGLAAAPRLDVEVEARSGAVQLRSRINYPDFVSRAEMRLYQTDGAGRTTLLQIVPIVPNGAATVETQSGTGIHVVHRVYDAKGRYDETHPLSLSDPDRRGLASGVEDGSDFTARRRIPISGGSVTVSGTGLRPGERIQTLGTELRASPDGAFVVQRILPPGKYPVTIALGSGRATRITRDVTIPERDWFGVGVADITLGRRSGDIEGSRNYARGRLSGYTTIQTATGWRITASADTDEQDLKDLFRSFEDKDPTALLRRLDPTDYYPTFGDDSTSVDDAPTDGRFYLRAERGNDYAMWGTGRAPLDGSHYLRNERVLYGAHGRWQSDDQTAHGEARQTVSGYAAQPDRLPGRDVFRTTGGSVYFLSRQDLAVGTDVVTVEIRDGVTGRILSTRPLVSGVDYTLNTIQGVVTLSRPLSSYVLEGPIVGTGGSEPTANLTVQYEFTPVVGDLDGMAYGARGEAWVNDQVRVGITGQVERTASADQTASGIDLHYRLSDTSSIDLEYARSDGPGFGSTFSADGGFTIVTNPAQTGAGEALRLEGRLNYADLGYDSDGTISGYFERRTAGFTTLDYRVSPTTGSETLWGVAGDAALSSAARLAYAVDVYENSAGEHERVGTAEFVLARGPDRELSYAIEHTDKTRGTDAGSRTDAAIRLTQRPSETLEWYVYGQATLDRDGLEENHRVGIGGTVETRNDWTISGEISAGSTGAGARVLAEKAREDGGSAYFGYELDPGRDIAGVTLSGQDRGRIVAGGRAPVSETTTIYGENTYDMFGVRRSLLSRYGVDYTPRSELTYSLALDVGEVDDSVNGDIERRGVSLGVRYDDKAVWRVRGRLEFRQDQRNGTATVGDTTTWLASIDGRYKINDTRRLVFGIKHSETDADNSTVAEGRLSEITLGYALRPVDNDRFNLLARYRYLFDDYGQRVDGSDTPGPRQRSHIFSIDGEHQVGERWSLGGKLGLRYSETAADATSPFVANDAYIAIASARYHVTHKWDGLLELRHFEAVDSGFEERGALAAIYRKLGRNAKLGVGYNFTTFSDDLSDLTLDNQGLFLNFVARY